MAMARLLSQARRRAQCHEVVSTTNVAKSNGSNKAKTAWSATTLLGLHEEDADQLSLEQHDKCPVNVGTGWLAGFDDDGGELTAA